MHIEMPRKTRWMLVIAAGVIMGAALGIRNVHGLYLVPVTMDRGWTREAFSVAFAVQNLVWGLAQPFTGMIADRCGAAKVIFLGALIYAAGLVVMACSTTAMMFAMGNGVLIGIALSGAAFGTVYGALSRVVPVQNQSWALGVAGAIGGLGQFAAVPATHQMIEQMGWVSSLLVLAAVMVVVSPLATMLREKSPETIEETSGDLGLGKAVQEALSHGGFWLLNLGFVACGFQLAFLIGHLPAYLIDRGMDPADGGVAFALIALGNVIGMYLCGHLGGIWPHKYVLSGLYFLRAGIMTLFVALPLSTETVYGLSFAMGLVWLGTVPLTTGLVAHVFGVRYIATLFGIVFFGHQVGSFFGVWLGGYVFDMTQSYDLIWLISIVLGLIAAFIHLPINDQKFSPPAHSRAKAV